MKKVVLFFSVMCFSFSFGQEMEEIKVTKKNSWFKAGIIAGVPFVDALTTMLDDTLPLTPPEWTEWGNPIESAADYATIAAYSPYDNVAALPYPPILAMAGLTDPRVTYWEPAKWVAKLRDLKTNNNFLFLDTNMDAGHGGASGRFEALRDLAKEFSFLLDLEKIKS